MYIDSCTIRDSSGSWDGEKNEGKREGLFTVLPLKALVKVPFSSIHTLSLTCTDLLSLILTSHVCSCRMYKAIERTIIVLT